MDQIGAVTYSLDTKDATGMYLFMTYIARSLATRGGWWWGSSVQSRSSIPHMDHYFIKTSSRYP